MLARSAINTHQLLVGVQIFTAIIEISVGFFQRLGIDILQDLARPFSGTYTKTFYFKNMYSAVSIDTLFITARNWKQSRCPSVDERKDRMWYIYTKNITQY